MKELNIDTNQFTFITDSSLHLRQTLIPECTKKNIKLPDYYFTYHDIRKEFQKYAGLNQRINSLDEILNCKLNVKSNSIKCKLKILILSYDDRA